MTRGIRLFNKNIADRNPVRACTVGEAFPLPVTEPRVQPGEGPVKGGGNCDPRRKGVVKLGYMLEPGVCSP